MDYRPLWRRIADFPLVAMLIALFALMVGITIAYIIASEAIARNRGVGIEVMFDLVAIPIVLLIYKLVIVRLGRSADPTDDRGRPRLNDVAFVENDSPENRTVTRGHALIRFDARTGEYRLFDEGSANGTQILRSGEAIDVPRRDPIGVSLRSGDEIQLGKAAIRIKIGDSSS